MTTVPGDKNRPTIAATSAPEFADDLDQVSAFAALMGNVREGTNSERLALATAEKWDGLTFIETDTGFVYQRLAGAWIKDRKIQATNTWKAKRVGGTSDSFVSGSFASLCALGIPSAQAAAGDYIIGANWVIKGSADLIQSNLRLLAGSTSLNDDSAYDVGMARQQSAFSYPYTHSGGDLTITLLFQVSTGTGTVYKAGTSLWAEYVGP